MVTQISQPVATSSGSAQRRGKLPKVVKSKDPEFDFECEGDDGEEDKIQNKYRLGEETKKGMNNILKCLI